MESSTKTLSWQLRETPKILYEMFNPLWSSVLVILTVVTGVCIVAQVGYNTHVEDTLPGAWWIIGFIWFWFMYPLVGYIFTRLVYHTDLWRYTLTKDKLIARIESHAVEYKLQDLKISKNQEKVLVVFPRKRRLQVMLLYLEDMNLKHEIVRRIKEANGN